MAGGCSAAQRAGLSVPYCELFGGRFPSNQSSLVDFILAASSTTGSWPFTASRITLALKAGLCFLRPFYSFFPFRTATSAPV